MHLKRNRRAGHGHAFLFATILLVGDSHTYLSFGRKLDALLRQVPDTSVATYASCGSSPYGWFVGSPTRCGYFEKREAGPVIDLPTAPTPLFGDLLSRHAPRLTIVALGANLFGAPLEHSAITAHQMAEMASLAHSQCLWVGPPDSRERSGPAMTELYGVLRGAATPYCRFIDSRTLTHYPPSGGDGTHYDSLGPEGIQQAEAWAAKIFEEAKKLIAPR